MFVSDSVMLQSTRYYDNYHHQGLLSNANFSANGRGYTSKPDRAFDEKRHSSLPDVLLIFPMGLLHDVSLSCQCKASVSFSRR